jgi:uncharacterized protein YjeT (DUF2065 family)
MYVYTYLIVGGVGLLVVPDVALRLLLSNGSYGDIMPRVVGMFMIALGGLVLQFVRARDYRYYGYAILARSFIVFVLVALHVRSMDPMFVVLAVIVLIGLIPSIVVALRGKDEAA